MSILSKENTERAKGTVQPALMATLPRLEVQFDPVITMDDDHFFNMVEYMANGAQLGWLLIPETQDVYIYRPDTAPEHLSNPTQISGEPIATGFTLDLADIWDAGF